MLPLPITCILVLLSYAVYKLLISPRYNPLHQIAGPPVKGFIGNLSRVLDPFTSPRVHELYVRTYGRSIRIRGLGPWDERLLTLDPLSIQHVLKHSTIYEKPWQSRKLITSLIGCGMLSAEGQVHRRQRRVATPAFSIQNLRELVPLVFEKGSQLKDKWVKMTINGSENVSDPTLTLDVCHWISRATFDVIGIAGFDYHFNAIHDESNELFLAYKEMFEVAISQGKPWRTAMTIYAPFVNKLLPDDRQRTVYRCQEIIGRVAGKLIQEKKHKIEEAAQNGQTYGGKDLLSLLLKSNTSSDISPENRISDEDILHNINTFMFAGSDTSSLSLTWTLYLLAQNPDIQNRLRKELLSIAPTTDVSDLTVNEIQSLYTNISNLPYLHNVVRESMRLIPPVHSSIRVATQDDEIPAMYPIHKADGTVESGKTTLTVPKGSFVHVAIEGFNLDKEIWGEDAWEFNPERWDVLPEKAQQQPGLFSNTLTFSAGPRSCIGMRFSLIETKTFLHILLTHFVFLPTEEKINKVNVILTRPFLSGKYTEGSQLPLIVKLYKADQCSTI